MLVLEVGNFGKLSHEGAVLINGISALMKKILLGLFLFFSQCEDPARRHLSTNQEIGPHQIPIN